MSSSDESDPPKNSKPPPKRLLKRKRETRRNAEVEKHETEKQEAEKQSCSSKDTSRSSSSGGNRPRSARRGHTKPDSRPSTSQEHEPSPSTSIIDSSDEDLQEKWNRGAKKQKLSGNKGSIKYFLESCSPLLEDFRKKKREDSAFRKSLERVVEGIRVFPNNDSVLKGESDSTDQPPVGNLQLPFTNTLRNVLSSNLWSEKENEDLAAIRKSKSPASAKKKSDKKDRIFSFPDENLGPLVFSDDEFPHVHDKEIDEYFEAQAKRRALAASSLQEMESEGVSAVIENDTKRSRKDKAPANKRIKVPIKRSKKASADKVVNPNCAYADASSSISCKKLSDSDKSVIASSSIQDEEEISQKVTSIAIVALPPPISSGDGFLPFDDEEIDECFATHPKRQALASGSSQEWESKGVSDGIENVDGPFGTKPGSHAIDNTDTRRSRKEKAPANKRIKVPIKRSKKASADKVVIPDGASADVSSSISHKKLSDGDKSGMSSSIQDEEEMISEEVSSIPINESECSEGTDNPVLRVILHRLPDGIATDQMKNDTDGKTANSNSTSPNKTQDEVVLPEK